MGWSPDEPPSERAASLRVLVDFQRVAPDPTTFQKGFETRGVKEFGVCSCVREVLDKVSRVANDARLLTTINKQESVMVDS